MGVIVLAVFVVAVVVAHDLTQRKHAILRNFPIIGHFRYLFEAVGPELRQYIVTSNTEERPFSREPGSTRHPRMRTTILDLGRITTWNSLPII
jgi:hypothetical protein